MTTNTRTWKVYGFEGHRISLSFEPSFAYDWTTADGVRIVSIECSDKTGTNDFVIVRITRNTAAECEAELNGQLSDGFFENVRFGDWEEI